MSGVDPLDGEITFGRIDNLSERQAGEAFVRMLRHLQKEANEFAATLRLSSPSLQSARRSGASLHRSWHNCPPTQSETIMTDPATMTDRELLAAYLATDGIPGDPIVEALLAEIVKRDLDV